MLSILGRRRAEPRMPGPVGSPFLGVLPQLRNDSLRFVTETAHEFPDIARISLGLETLYFVSDPDAVEHVLATNARNYRKSRFYERLEPFFGESLFTTNGEEWLHQRRAAQPAFSMGAIASFVSSIVEETNGLIRRWERLAEPTDVAEDMMQLGLRIAFRTLFGEVITDADALTMHQALSVFLRWGERRVWALTQISAVLPTSDNRRFYDARETVLSVMMRIVASRRASGGMGTDLLSRIMQSRHSNGRTYTDRELCFQAASVLLAGHETGAAALAWTWFLLSMHPETASKIRTEVSEVCGEGNPGGSELQRLAYTAMVFQESMRLYPPIWTLSREALVDDEVCGYRLPAGSVVMASPYSMHRDARFWPTPDQFEPERFDPTRHNERPLYAYFPFGGGPRKCIGHRFAFIEGITILAMLCRRFVLNVHPGHIVELEPMISLRPRYGMMMDVHSIDSANERTYAGMSDSASASLMAKEQRRTMA